MVYLLKKLFKKNENNFYKKSNLFSSKPMNINKKFPIKESSFEIKCPICIEYDIIINSTIKIEENKNKCPICLNNNSEILCNNCQVINICMECALRLKI